MEFVAEAAEGVRIATFAHLPLTVIRLRLAAADAGVPGAEPRHIDRIVAHAQEWPRLLRFFARAVQARLAGADLDASTKAFISTCGAISRHFSTWRTPHRTSERQSNGSRQSCTHACGRQPCSSWPACQSDERSHWQGVPGMAIPTLRGARSRAA